MDVWYIPGNRNEPSKWISDHCASVIEREKIEIKALQFKQ